MSAPDEVNGKMNWRVGHSDGRGKRRGISLARKCGVAATGKTRHDPSPRSGGFQPPKIRALNTSPALFPIIARLRRGWSSSAVENRGSLVSRRAPTPHAPTHGYLMKVIQVQEFGGPQVLKLAEAPMPQPNPTQVLIRMRAAGVNPVDTYIRAGSYALKPTLPYIPGSDGAGVIETVGDDVSVFKPGDRVYTAAATNGTYAEVVVCDAVRVHPLPPGISFTQGAAIGVPYATAYRALFQRGAAVRGETVLVHGASGGVGVAAVQLARAHGLRVLATAGTERGRQLVAGEGADQVFDHHAPEYLRDILQATGGAGVNLILEMLANLNLGNDLALLASRGRVVMIGSRGQVKIDPRDAMSRDADIRGMVLFNTPVAELAGIHAALFAGLEAGDLRPIIGKEFPLEKASEAHEAVMQPGAFGKIVLLP